METCSGEGATCTQGREGIRERRGPSLDSSTDPIITLNQLVKFNLVTFSELRSTYNTIHKG